MSLPVHSVISLGIGVALRIVLDHVFSANERISGTLVGVWDGALAHIAWRTDTLLEPIVLIETIGVRPAIYALKLFLMSTAC